MEGVIVSRIVRLRKKRFHFTAGPGYVLFMLMGKIWFWPISESTACRAMGIGRGRVSLQKI